MSDDGSNLKIAILAYSEDEAPSKAHEQWLDVIHFLFRESDVVVEPNYLTLDRDDYEGVVEEIGGVMPEFSYDFLECPDDREEDN